MANGARHTKGPWCVGAPKPARFPAHRILAGNKYVAEVTIMAHNPAQADARLIAAAPELLAGLERAVQYFDDNGGEREYTWLPQMKAALASARGE